MEYALRIKDDLHCKGVQIGLFRAYDIFKQPKFYKEKMHKHYFLSLEKDFNQLIKKFKRTVRQALNRAIASGLNVIEGSDKNDLRAFYRLYMETRKRNNVPTQPFLFYLLQKRMAEAELAARGRNAGAVYSSLQWLKWRSFERGVCRQADRVVCVSDADAIPIQRLDPNLKAHVIPNGVDTDFYQRQNAVPLDLPAPALVFTGTMDFRPNVDAMLWFAQEVLHLIRSRLPEVRVYVVGQRPHARLDALRGDPAITITGGVSETRPYIADASVYIVPLRMGGGTRLKLRLTTY